MREYQKVSSEYPETNSGLNLYILNHTKYISVKTMPKKSQQQNPNICPRCGVIVPSPKRTWQLVAPIPDGNGRITITVMGAYECPSCNYRWRAVISKMKVGGDSIEIESLKGKGLKLTSEEKESRKPTVIELDLKDILEEE